MSLVSSTPISSSLGSDDAANSVSVGIPFQIKHMGSHGGTLAGDGSAGTLCTLEKSSSSEFIEDSEGRWRLNLKVKKNSPKLYLSVFGGNLTAGSLVTMSEVGQAVLFKQKNGLLRAFDKKGNMSKFFVKAASSEDSCFLMLGDANNDKSSSKHKFALRPTGGVARP